jgi:hypothetical protein
MKIVDSIYEEYFQPMVESGAFSKEYWDHLKPRKDN